MPDEVTPPRLFFNRRKWIQAAALGGSVSATVAAYRLMKPIDSDVTMRPPLENLAESDLSKKERLQAGFDCGESRSSLYDVTHMNNFHEFTLEQTAVAQAAKDFKTDDWTLDIGGLVQRPLQLSIDQIRQQFTPEERTYRMRCVEAWSLVVPWAGFPLAAIMDLVKPTSEAKYVAFTSLHDPKRMPNQVLGELQWPYTEGLRMDEAAHSLTFLATGLYGMQLPPENGAPVRLVVPWKYGFKSIKSLVKIEFVKERPETAWNKAAPHENGFFANVNPNVDHPRWSQATERRVGEFLRRDTLLYNGYEKQVEHLYRGMDLNVDY